MVDERLRTEPEALAERSQAPAQVNVLAVHEELLVEAADGLERSAINQGTGTADPRRLPGCWIEALRMLDRDLARLDGAGIRPGIGARRQPRQQMRRRQRVWIQDQQAGA